MITSSIFHNYTLYFHNDSYTKHKIIMTFENSVRRRNYTFLGSRVSKRNSSVDAVREKWVCSVIVWQACSSCSVARCYRLLLINGNGLRFSTKLKLEFCKLHQCVLWKYWRLFKFVNLVLFLKLSVYIFPSAQFVFELCHLHQLEVSTW